MRENLLIIGKKVGDKRRRSKMSSRFNGARSWSISSLFGLSDISQFELFCFVENNIGHNVCHGGFTANIPVYKRGAIVDTHIHTMIGRSKPIPKMELAQHRADSELSIGDHKTCTKDERVRFSGTVP